MTADEQPVRSTSSTYYPDPLFTLDSDQRWTKRIVQWAVNARSHRVICLVAGIWLLNGFDLTLTLISHQLGLLNEENPLAAHLLQYGAYSIILYKIGLVMVGSYPLLRFRQARITEMAAILILIVYAWLAVHWSECYELYALMGSPNIHLAELAPSSSP